MGMCACLCPSVHVRSGRGDVACVCGSECLEWVCVPVCVCPCMCTLVGIITRVYARVRVWSGCVSVCVHPCIMKW